MVTDTLKRRYEYGWISSTPVKLVSIDLSQTKGKVKEIQKRAKVKPVHLTRTNQRFSMTSLAVVRSEESTQLWTTFTYPFAAHDKDDRKVPYCNHKLSQIH